MHKHYKKTVDILCHDSQTKEIIKYSHLKPERDVVIPITSPLDWGIHAFVCTHTKHQYNNNIKYMWMMLELSMVNATLIHKTNARKAQETILARQKHCVSVK